jgi:hypothetical protein
LFEYFDLRYLIICILSKCVATPAAKRNIEAIAAMVAAMMVPTAANKESIETMLNGEE